jgi:hypothetical protein
MPSTLRRPGYGRFGWSMTCALRSQSSDRQAVALASRRRHLSVLRLGQNARGFDEPFHYAGALIFLRGESAARTNGKVHDVSGMALYQLTRAVVPQILHQWIFAPSSHRHCREPTLNLHRSLLALLGGRLVAEMESCIVIAGSGYQGSSAFATGQTNLQVRPESA